MTGDDTTRGRRIRGYASLVVVLVVVGGGLVVAIQSEGPAAPMDATRSFPPGTSSAGIDAPSRLVDAHRRALSASGSLVVLNRIDATGPSTSPRPER
jgi:hypothetical protein